MKENQHLEELSERFISVDEAADYLHLKKGTLHNWLSEGKNGFKRIKLADDQIGKQNRVVPGIP